MVIKSVPCLPDINRSSWIFLKLLMNDYNTIGSVDGKEVRGLFGKHARYFEHYYDHAKFRLKNIHVNYGRMAEYFANEHKKCGNTNLHQVWSDESNQIFWDFEDYITAIRTSLDILTVICRPAYKGDTPRTFFDYCEFSITDPLHDLFEKANINWAGTMRNYRVQYIHYAPINDVPAIRLLKHGSDFELNARIPDSPLKTPGSKKFTYEKNIDVLTYSIDLFNHLSAFETSVATEIELLSKNREYPKHIRF